MYEVPYLSSPGKKRIFSRSIRHFLVCGGGGEGGCNGEVDVILMALALAVTNRVI